MPKTVRRRRVRVAPKPTPLEQTGNYLLETADEIFKRSAGLDTAVRDSIAQGLAYIVHAGNDCLSSGRSIPFTQWIGAIEWSTAEWFRARGFVEWFCVGAASLFRTSRPREIHMDNIAAVRLKKNGK